MYTAPQSIYSQGRGIDHWAVNTLASLSPLEKLTFLIPDKADGPSPVISYLLIPPADSSGTEIL